MPQVIAIPLSIALAAASIGASAVQIRQGNIAQKRAIRQQEEAQRLATSRAASEQRRQEMESRGLNKKKPNVASLLGEERRDARRGPGGTLLTGAGGVPNKRLTLGQSSLLGNT